MMHLNNSIRYKRSFVNINPQLKYRFTQSNVYRSFLLYMYYTWLRISFSKVLPELLVTCPPRCLRRSRMASPWTSGRAGSSSTFSWSATRPSGTRTSTDSTRRSRPGLTTWVIWNGFLRILRLKGKCWLTVSALVLNTEVEEKELCLLFHLET